MLELFKKYKTKFGVVVDEYGDITGILTLHDLTESIFGDILEEDEEAVPGMVERPDGSWSVDGNMQIDDFMDKMDILLYEDIEHKNFTTLSGMAMYFLGRVPREGDVFVYRDLEFEVVDMDNSRVDKLFVRRKAEQE